MKFAVVLLAVFGVAFGLPTGHDGISTFGLKEDLDQFIELLPTDQIVAIAIDYLANDAEVQEAVEYLQADEFKGLILEIESIPEYKKFLATLQENGLNVYYYLSKLHEILGLPEFQPKKVSTRGTGIRGLLDDIEAILPLDEIKALFYETLDKSPAFRNIIELMRGDEFKGIVAELRANEKFQHFIQKAKDHGVDIQLVVDLLNKIFGWDIETSAVVFGIQDDLQDFLQLVPVEEVLGIAIDYLANDEEVQEVIEYVQSNDFKNLVKEVDQIPEYLDFLNTLHKNGFDVYTIVNKIHELLGLPSLPVPGSRKVSLRGKGVRGLLDDILAVLPTEEIKALFYKKLETSSDFAKLVELLRSNEFKTIVDKLRANSEFQEIIERAKQHGVDIEAIIEILNKIFGWGIEY